MQKTVNQLKMTWIDYKSHNFKNDIQNICTCDFNIVCAQL